MKKSIILIFILFIISLNYANDFSYEKLSESYVSGAFDTENTPILNYPYIYFGSKYGMQTFLIHDNGNLERVSVLPIEGELRHIVRKDNYIYVSAWFIENDSSALYKISISNPAQPQIVLTKNSENRKYILLSNIGNSLAYVHKINNLFYLTFFDSQTLIDATTLNINGLVFNLINNNFAVEDSYDLTSDTIEYKIYNVENPQNIEFVKSFELPAINEYPYYKMIDNNTLVRLTSSNATFYNVSDSLSVTQLSSINFDPGSSKIGGCIKKDNYLLVPDNWYIDIFNIEDINNPVFVERKCFSESMLSFFPNPIVDTGEYLYMGTFLKGILKMSFNNNNLEFLGFHCDNNPNAPYFTIRNNKLYMPLWYGGIAIFDLSDPANPVFETKILPDKQVRNKISFIDDNKIIVPYSYYQGEKYLAKYDISDLENPVLLYQISINYERFWKTTNPNESNNIVYLVQENYNQNGITISKYDFSSDENANLLFNYTANESFHFGLKCFFKNQKFYLYNYDLSFKLCAFSGFEENNPEYLGPITGINPNNETVYFADYSSPYFEVVTYNAYQAVHYYNINNLDSQELFTTKTRGYDPYSIIDNGMLLTRGSYSLNVFDIHNNPSGVLDKNSMIKLNSDSPTFTVFERNGIKYLYVIQAECISVYSYNITANGNININPLNDYAMKNYPNPFNPTTTISFDLPKSANVDLSIYNIKGQKVKTLTDEKYSKGKHSLIWNGTNDENQNVGSGVYFYKLNVNGKNITVRKCLLLK